MSREDHLLTKSLLETFHKVSPILRSLYDDASTLIDDNYEPTEEHDQLVQSLGYYVEKAFRDTALLAEKLRLPGIAAEIAKARSSIKDICATTIDFDAFTFRSPPLETAREYFDSLCIITQGREVTGVSVFQNILKNAGRIMRAQNFVPTSEAEVRERLMEVLSFAFPDVVREIPIEKSLKTYRPDLGVVSLMAAAEVKFAVTASEAKAALDGLYADMKGYGGHDDWRSFFAVIYMTEEFFRQDDVEREFGLVRAEMSWTPIVVFGPGERKKKK